MNSQPQTPDNAPPIKSNLHLLWISFLVGIAITVGIFLYWRSHQPAPSGLSTKVHLGWLISGAYGGEALAAEKFGPMEGIDITLQPGGPGLDPLRLVKDGTFGVASADEVIRVIEKGAPLVIVGVLNEDAPAAFAALLSSGITNPTNFIGKRVGILPFGSTGLIYQSLLARQNIKPGQVTEVPISADLRPFITGSTHDVQPIYVYDETVSLDAQNIKYSLILPRDYGVVFKGPVYFTTKDTIKNHPELVQRFILAAILGWRQALQSPDSAIDALARIAPSIDKKRELEVLKRALPYYGDAKRKPLTTDVNSWQQMIDDMVKFKVLANPIDPKAFLDMSFVNDTYRDLDRK